ncbi:MucR family transcriptional regulator [Propylenella binzhouense]|uniref:MucR family transcriptional regulator n=1 Tax=Propylenella binzhouense TaxID=2555902 RepID=A0A964T207_9HYPH|nr:MucR family transcriptional regulator [Propylenella binzhouense]MYZ47006.1 MucR family transcriptional regulator [Propylenella binzhouense]
MEEAAESSRYVELAAEIVAAFVSHNSIAPADLPKLIGDVANALQESASPTAKPEPEPLVPAVPVKKSINPDFLVCLEDGMKFKSLKRHLRTHHNLSPDEYRQKWNLPADYPMVAPNYAQARSDLAKSMGLGQKRPAAKQRRARSKAA